jgi:PAS domain S-box-containing protein
MLMPNENIPALLEHEQLNSLINSMTDGVIALDKHLKIVQYNGAALNILDRNSSVQGRNIDEVLRLINSDKKPVIVAELIHSSTTSTESRDYSMPYEDGSISAIYVSIAPVHERDGRGGIEGYVLILRDITHEKSLEEERSEFISVVSHELRTPITIAEGSVSNAMLALEKGGKPEAMQKALRTAHDQILFLATMINDLSTLSRAERGILNLEVQTINITDLLRNLVTSYKSSADEKSLSLALTIDPKIEMIESSELYIKEILQNFITNAIKYTDEGGVSVEAKQVLNGVSVSISDTGIGISKLDRDKIFDKFFRSEDYRTRKNSGTGLGLYVTMKLVKIIGANIDIKSELNKGSTFTVTFQDMSKQPTL